MNKDQINSVIANCWLVKDDKKTAEQTHTFIPQKDDVRITPKGNYLSGNLILQFLEIAEKNTGHPCSFMMGVKDGKPELIIF